ERRTERMMRVRRQKESETMSTTKRRTSETRMQNNTTSAELTKRLADARAEARPRIIPAQELEACRLDPAWEARRGIANRVVCKICGVLVCVLGSKNGHLRLVHHISVSDYLASYPGARLQSFERSYVPSIYDTQGKMARFASGHVTPEELEA